MSSGDFLLFRFKRRHFMRSLTTGHIHVQFGSEMILCFCLFKQCQHLKKELKMSEMVELIVETAAEARVTGFSVSGGGKEGIFIKEVLKDSRAAKALNLKE
eukprot:g44313.t1